jgi:GNAT superfamily N-acetyltransferase
MADVTIRPARIDDAEDFVRAHEAAWNATIGAIVGRPLHEFASFEGRVDRYRASFEQPLGDAGVWVAEHGGELVGIAIRVGSELRDLSVVPEAWGTGVAGALMGAALDAIRSDGAVEATLWVGEANARARRFYEREGWEPTGETRASQLGPAELQYRRQLASAGVAE